MTVKALTLAPAAAPAPLSEVPSTSAGALASRASFRALAGGLTPIDGPNAARHLARAYQEVTGTPPSSRTLDLLWAQWALETARGQAMYGNNFGGIKARPGATGAVFETTEGHGASFRRIRDRFRTYGTPEEGARDYVGLLARRYPVAFEALRVGDVDGFAAGLARAGYFTAHPETYKHGLERLASEHSTGLAPHNPSPVTQVLLEGLRRSLDGAFERES